MISYAFTITLGTMAGWMFPLTVAIPLMLVIGLPVDMYVNRRRRKRAS